MTLEELGISVDDWLAYIRGGEIDPSVEKTIDEHFSEIELSSKGGE